MSFAKIAIVFSSVSLASTSRFDRMPKSTEEMNLHISATWSLNIDIVLPW